MQGWPGAYQLRLFEPKTFDRVWRWRATLPDRKNKRCRILARGRLNTCLIEFEDGVRHIVSRNAIMKAKLKPQEEDQ